MLFLLATQHVREEVSQILVRRVTALSLEEARRIVDENSDPAFKGGVLFEEVVSPLDDLREGPCFYEHGDE
ncbi:hypothetical protein A3C60_00305 [Candidatus Nomurabacteria bacterium RIFCSPHIGHO2_02_FULL_37_45]|uniref:Uncharacterized protein n=1 Tax=Candidatus Nomurabacteria bacterium RIFCSPHIGHO2_12_FULL_37_29 TaxID=1801759 RepID=A0A1F6WC43_9BACT|nr:MAG: hypothetical protein A3C60_00305 [Candidatus Nomurabacteria bacterium RIFCSPHIGHO2_02_FULL_37_45]OGI79459.1 MAG: hypothetical protein A3F19_00605 [Candidatus Nomurabacteria bacterium RIFCSPHIGHO2_12_FULL_37_29]